MANYYRTCLSVLTSLNKDFPRLSLGRHISTALADYGDVFNMPDVELARALKKYHSTLLLNVKIKDEEDMFMEDDEEGITSLEDDDNW